MIRLFVLFTILGFTEIVHTELSSTPIKPNSIQLKELATIKNDDGFYNSINTFVAENGTILVMDRGNYQIKMFSPTGKFIRAFGKKGQGPGEFINGQMRNLCISKNTIIVQLNTKMMIFDFDGNLLHEIKEYTRGANIYPTDNGFRYVYRESNNPKISSKSFDFNGNVLEEIRNPKYDPENKSEGKDYYDYVKRAEEIAKYKAMLASNITPYKNGYIQSYPGKYKFEILDNNFKHTQTVTRPFSRIIDDFDYKRFYEHDAQDISEKYRAEWINTALRGNAVTQNIFNGFKHDIQEIVGTYNDYIILSVASEKDNGIADQFKPYFKHHYKFDVISPDFKYYTSFSFHDLGLSYADDITWMKIFNNKLMLELHNEDDGFYVKVMDINIL